MSLLLLRLLLRLLEADAAGAGVVATLGGLLGRALLLEADAAGARIVGALGELLRRIRLQSRRLRDRRRAGRMGRHRQNDETGRAEQRVADEQFHDASPGVGRDDYFTLRSTDRDGTSACLAQARQIVASGRHVR